MTQIVATRSYLKDVVFLGANQAGTDLSNAIIAEGIDDPANFFELAEDYSVKTLCQNSRKPAGTETHPDCIAPNPNPQNLTSPRVARSGHDISAICEKILNIAAYGANIFTSVGRQFNTASLSRSRLREFKRHNLMVDKHNDPEYLPELSKTFTIMKILDQMPTHLI